MKDTLDQTTLATLDLMVSRLDRIEHVLHGQTHPQVRSEDDPAARRVRELEKHLSLLTSNIRPYADLLGIYRSAPDLFHEAGPRQPPSQLDRDAIEAIVLSSASSFPATLSTLRAIEDCPIPDPQQSAGLVALTGRMKAIEAVQISQTAELAELRQRSEAVMRIWYERGVVSNSQALADIESRAEKVERRVRRGEKEIELRNEI